MSVLLSVGSGLFGALIGSFLNVVVWRVPRGESLSTPASHCPNCQHAIRWYDNVPVISWLVLRAKCRDCGAPISKRYPLVEGVTSLLFLAVSWWAVATGALGAVGSGAQTAAFFIALVLFLYLLSISVALTLIDIDTHRLPNVIVLPALLVGAVGFTAIAVILGDFAPLIRALIGSGSLFLVYFLMALLYPKGMGFGDVKLAAVLGLFLGWLGIAQLIVGAFAAFVLGGLFGIALLAFGKAGRKTKIPFGPWMLGGAWIGIFVGEYIAQWYLGMFGLS